MRGHIGPRPKPWSKTLVRQSPIRESWSNPKSKGFGYLTAAASKRNHPLQQQGAESGESIGGAARAPPDAGVLQGLPAPPHPGGGRGEAHDALRHGDARQRRHHRIGLEPRRQEDRDGPSWRGLELVARTGAGPGDGRSIRLDPEDARLVYELLGASEASNVEIRR